MELQRQVSSGSVEVRGSFWRCMKGGGSMVPAWFDVGCGVGRWEAGLV